MNFDISIIVPTYKPQSYIEDCIESLANQTFLHNRFEILIVLNGPKDPFFIYIESLLGLYKDLNVRLLYSENAGVSNARNLGIENAKGEYITFIDDDDWISSAFLETLIKYASPETVPLSYALSYNDETKVYSDYYVTRKFEEGKCVLINSARSYFSGPVYKLIHRNIIGDVRYDIRLKNGEDTLFMFAISKNIKQCVYTSKDAIYYRRIRESSANFTKRAFTNKLKSNLLQISMYVRNFSTAPNKFDIRFFLSRCMGAVVGIFR